MQTGCRRVKESLLTKIRTTTDRVTRYGFKKTLKPGDLVAKDANIWPFADREKYLEVRTKPDGEAQGDGQPLVDLATDKWAQGAELDHLLQIKAIMVFNDSRDWGLDTQVILDLLLSYRGFYGTRPIMNKDTSYLNQGFLQHRQPKLYFTNADLWWASAYHWPRLGQGAFIKALEGVWDAATSGPSGKAEMYCQKYGKPFAPTYIFAEKVLNQLHREKHGTKSSERLETIYVVGDNPKSDIVGARWYGSKAEAYWKPILVRTGVYDGIMRDGKPYMITKDVFYAVQRALLDAQEYQRDDFRRTETNDAREDAR